MQESKRWDGRGRVGCSCICMVSMDGMRRHCSDRPYNCPVMDMQRSGSLADSAPGPREQKTFSRSQHAVLATVRALRSIMCQADVAMFMHGNGMDG